MPTTKGGTSCEAEMLACGSDLCEVGKGRGHYMDTNLILMRGGFCKFAIYGRFSNFPNDCGFHLHLRLEDEYTSPFIEVRSLLVGLDIAVESDLRY